MNHEGVLCPLVHSHSSTTSAPVEKVILGQRSDSSSLNEG